LLFWQLWSDSGGGHRGGREDQLSVAGPWRLLGLMLTGPFALLVTFVVVGLVAAALLVTIAAIFAAPSVLVRGLHRRYRASQAISVPATQVASSRSRHVAA
jgi:hypothetical protein